MKCIWFLFLGGGCIILNKSFCGLHKVLSWEFPPGIVNGENVGRVDPILLLWWELCCPGRLSKQLTGLLRCPRYSRLMCLKLDWHFVSEFFLSSFCEPGILDCFHLFWSPTSCPVGHQVIRCSFLNNPQTWPRLQPYCHHRLFHDSFHSHVPTGNPAWVSSSCENTRYLLNYYYYLKDLFILERERVRGRKNGRKSRGRGRLQADSLLSAEPKVGFELRTLRSCPELKPRVGRLTSWATQVS